MWRGLTVGCLTMAVLTSAGFPVPAHAQAVPFPIAVLHSGQDALGAEFVDRINEVLRYSPRYTLVESEEQAVITLRISTLDHSPANPGLQSAAGWSLVLTKRNDAYLAGGIRSFDARRAGQSADELAIAVDAVVSEHREWIPGSLEAQQIGDGWNAAVEQAAEKIRSGAQRKLYLQYMELQRTAFQMSGILLPTGATVIEFTSGVATEFEEACVSAQSTKPPVRK
jgi:hypothetical protein